MKEEIAARPNVGSIHKSLLNDHLLPYPAVLICKKTAGIEGRLAKSDPKIDLSLCWKGSAPL